MSTVRIEGIDQIQALLNERAPRAARNLMRATVQAVTQNIAKDARGGARKRTGKMRKAIKAKRKKSPPNMPTSQVLVGEGKGKDPDAFYWKFEEYGTRFSPAAPFIEPAKERAKANMKAMLVQEFGKKLEKQLAREARGAR